MRKKRHLNHDNPDNPDNLNNPDNPDNLHIERKSSDLNNPNNPNNPNNSNINTSIPEDIKRLNDNLLKLFQDKLSSSEHNNPNNPNNPNSSNSPKEYQKLQQVRKRLPAYLKKKEIIDTIMSNQVKGCLFYTSYIYIYINLINLIALMIIIMKIL